MMKTEVPSSATATSQSHCKLQTSASRHPVFTAKKRHVDQMLGQLAEEPHTGGPSPSKCLIEVRAAYMPLGPELIPEVGSTPGFDIA